MVGSEEKDPISATTERRLRLLPPHEFHAFLIGVIRRVQSLDLASYEEKDADLAELRRTATAILNVATEVLGLVVDFYENVAGGHQTALPAEGYQLLREVDRRMEQMSGASDIADLAFIARLGLKGRLESLSACDESTERWDVIAVASGSCREVMKSLSALESAVCRFEGLCSENSYYETELSRSLATRRAYAAFRREIASEEPSSPDEVVKRLRLCAIAIAKLIGRDVYPHLRVSDRIHIRGLQERIVDFLRVSNQDTTRARAGLRVWQDLSSFADLLQQVNNRAELLEHDLSIVRDALQRLEKRAEGDAVVIAEATPALETLFGRDPALDRCLRDETSVTVGALRTVLVSLENHLTAATGVGRSPDRLEQLADLDEDFL